jgi:SPP1 family phage portal protein
MEIQDIINESDIGKRVESLKKGRISAAPNIDNIKKEWDPSQHAIIIDKQTYPDKEIKGNDGTLKRIEKINRIALPFQKLIVKRVASFLFGNPLKILSSNDESKLPESVRKILKGNKTKSLDRKIARILFAATEVAEYWYPVEMKEEKDLYGFSSKYKMRVAIFNPLKGDQLFPFFDETGDMVAFSRQYSVDENGKTQTFFETWTYAKYYKWKQSGSTWEELTDQNGIDLAIGKIPVVYAMQEETEWTDVQWSITRLEKLLSKFGNTNDYHGSPKIAVKGKVLGFSPKGEDGAILEMEGDGDAKYLSWDHAPESVKMEIDTHLAMIYTFCRIANTSFDNLKGIGPLSGIALRLMFSDTDALMTDKMEIFDEYMERRLNILKAYAGKMSKDLEKEIDAVEMSVERVPLIINDEAETVSNLATAVACGFMSKQTAVTKNPMVDDSEKELELLEEEAEAEREMENEAIKLDQLQNEELEEVV